jgi:Ser/Thr protein kinase RdoA (MazF antagonist)
VQEYLEASYPLTNVQVERIHVAGTFAVTIASAEQVAIFKLEAHEEEDALGSLLGRIEHLRHHGLPLARVHPRRDGAWFGTPFANPVAKGYLLDVVPGEPTTVWSAAHADATAAVFARLHQLGRDEPQQPGEQMSFVGCWLDLQEAVERLAAASVLPQETLARTHELVAAGPPLEDLVWTHIHGDARLCHVFFKGSAVSGIVDYESGVWGQRLLDVAFHLISHPDSARIAFLGVEAITQWLGRYDSRFPFTEAERSALGVALCCALLIEMGETLSNVETGRAGIDMGALAVGVTLLSDVLASLR